MKQTDSTRPGVDSKQDQNINKENKLTSEIDNKNINATRGGIDSKSLPSKPDKTRPGIDS